MNDRHDLTLDEALMWLNDRVGQQARVYVDVDIGSADATVLDHEHGKLKHHGGENPVLSKHGPRDDLAGRYEIGETNIDVTALVDSSITEQALGDSDVLTFGLADGVELIVATFTDDG